MPFNNLLQPSIWEMTDVTPLDPYQQREIRVQQSALYRSLIGFSSTSMIKHLNQFATGTMRHGRINDKVVRASVERWACAKMKLLEPFIAAMKSVKEHIDHHDIQQLVFRDYVVEAAVKLLEEQKELKKALKALERCFEIEPALREKICFHINMVEDAWLSKMEAVQSCGLFGDQ